MFTGIIESVGEVKSLQRSGGNMVLTIASDISHELKIDQSVAHNGVCLTVIDVFQNTHKVEAIDETLQKSNLNDLKTGSLVNLERCMRMDGRLDGHMVQGHVDTTADCTDKEEADGSWIFTFSHAKGEHFTVEKGSVCVNGVSLTVINSKDDGFSVAIIPYTYEHTNFHTIEVGTRVNLEFDIIGKYVSRMMKARQV